MSTTSITTINGRKCTARKIQNQNSSTGQEATTTTAVSSPPIATSITTTTTAVVSSSSSTPLASPSTATSVLTTFSTSSTPATNVTPFNPIKEPDRNTPVDATTDILVTTTNSPSSQIITSTTTSTISLARPDPPITPSSSSPATKAEKSSMSLIDFVSVIPGSATATSSSGLRTGGNASLLSTAKSMTSSRISTSTTSTVQGGAATTTTTTRSGSPNSSNTSADSTESRMSTQKIVAIAGGVIGGLALLTIIAFLLWFLRKRFMKKRRSTMLTPLSTGATLSGGEKGPYVMSRNSLGPTTMPEKMRVMVGYNFHRFRGRVNNLVVHSPQPSVDLNRGNSQYGLPDALVTGSTSRAGGVDDGAATTKDRFVDWWGRLTEDNNLNWKLRADARDNAATPTLERAEPDLLLPVSVDEGRNLQQQASRNNVPRNNSEGPRRSQSLGNNHFLSGLGLKLDMEDPFADSNVMSHDSARVIPLVMSGAPASNPFSDSNALPAPMLPANGNNNGIEGPVEPVTYVQSIRRSRGHSAGTANTRPPSGIMAGRIPSLYRESGVSIETSDTRRTKFRSDPFDLDRPELLARPSGGGTDTRDDGSRFSNTRGLPNMPRPARMRAESLTSRYPSGVSSLGEWSDPGPDVGPAAGRRYTPSPDSSLGRPQPSSNSMGVTRKSSGGNQSSVGKAI